MSASSPVQQNGINGSSDEETSPSTHEPVPTEPPQEEERTLTDHLNKKLLESFLTRLQQGTIELPQKTDEDSDEDAFSDS